MVRHTRCPILLIGFLLFVHTALAEQAGSIRGTAYDSDFDAPLTAAQVSIAETGETVVTSDEGNYVFGQVEPGNYTLVFSKNGYTRQVKADVVVSPGQMTEVNASLSGEFEEMEEFVVQDVRIGTGTEAALLDLRMESPSLLDSISADLMSQAGASDAAAALNLVSGATVQDGKYATIRGLPDRYVNSQMNGVRLPTADADKRAVQLDQFPSEVIESIQVSKTFTPDQQGDASGGAVNVVLKGVPDETTLKINVKTGWNTNVRDAGDKFLTYKGGGVNFWGIDDGTRDIPDDLNFTGPAGFSYGEAPMDYSWSITGGGKKVFDDYKIGGLGSFFYERDSSYFTNGIDDKYRIETPGGRVLPQYTADGSNGPDDTNWDPQNPGGEDFTTSLFDVTKSTQSVQWGGLGVIGYESEKTNLKLQYMYTRSAEDSVILAEDTRGKQFYFPGYDPADIESPANSSDGKFSAPYHRAQTLSYTERTTQTLQLSGHHVLPDLDFGVDNLFTLLEPELDWGISTNSASFYQPDKRLFGSRWTADSFSQSLYNLYANVYGFPDDQARDLATTNAQYWKMGDPSNVNVGNVQRIWKRITEESNQYNLNLKFPFEQWSGDEGYFKVGLFNDNLTREYRQESFANDGGNPLAGPEGPWTGYYWSDFYYMLPEYDQAGNIISAKNIDVNYDGKQNISAWYYMMDLPLFSSLNLIGGVRYEDTELSIKNTPDIETALLIVRNEDGFFVNSNYGIEDPDVSFKQQDVLPSIGFEFNPFDQVTFRGSYTETIARQTFKELSPIAQQEYLGGDVFVGNPNLKMSSLKNYDLRLDFTPYNGGLISASYFLKKIKDPIEYVQGATDFTFTTPVNFPEGRLSGFELEMRQQMGHFWDSLDGLSLGGNATFIDSEVTPSAEEYKTFSNTVFDPSNRPMRNAPEHLYNLFLTYDRPESGTNLALFYTVRGDTLIAGPGLAKGAFVPSVYETEYGTLNFSLAQKLGETWTLKFQAKNLLDPKIETVYRSQYLAGDVTKTSYTKGMDFSISLSAAF